MSQRKMTDKERTAMVEKLEKFQERARIYKAPAWRPVDGENSILSGEIIGFRKGSTDEYGDYPIIIVSTDTGPVAFHCFHTIVRERLAELGPTVGQLLTVMYNGRQESGKRTDSNGDPVKYHDYYIECGDAEELPVLDSYSF